MATRKFTLLHTTEKFVITGEVFAQWAAQLTSRTVTRLDVTADLAWKPEARGDA